MIFLKVKSFIQFTSYIQTVEGDTFNLKGLGSSPPTLGDGYLSFYKFLPCDFCKRPESVNQLIIYLSTNVMARKNQDLPPPCKSKANVAFTPFASHSLRLWTRFADICTAQIWCKSVFSSSVQFFLQIAESVPLKEACLLGCCVPTGYGAAVNVAKVCIKSVLRLSVINRNLR